MGACFSKKRGSSSSSPPSAAAVSSVAIASPNDSYVRNKTRGNNNNIHKVQVESAESELKLKKENTVRGTQEDQKVEGDEGGLVKKEIFVIKHRKSHDDRERGKDSRSPPPRQDTPLSPLGLSSTTTTTSSNEDAAESLGNKVTAGGVGVRTSSCTKEEVDAILIQCGRLSRSSSGKAASSSASCERNRKYSGSKRSYDFDRLENEVVAVDEEQKKVNGIENNALCGEDEERHHRQRHRQSPRPSSSQGRRRTPSRERDQQQRSSSRERRVSRSPGRRSSETATPASTATGNATAISSGARNSNKPGKMVSVPATVSSLVMDKSNNGGGGGGGESATATNVKRISVKRNAANDAVIAGSRSAASPRSRSPARATANAKISSDNQQQQPSLSRSSSRKAEHSPYRRNPLSEIDPNTLAYPQTVTNCSSKVQNRNKNETEGEGIVLEDSTNVMYEVIIYSI